MYFIPSQLHVFLNGLYLKLLVGLLKFQQNLTQLIWHIKNIYHIYYFVFIATFLFFIQPKDNISSTMLKIYFI